MESKKKILSEQEAYMKLSTLCATAEYCRADMRKKMEKWELPENAETHILARLTEEKYIDESRYTHAFVRDKFRYNHWGMTRIERELRMKGIDPYLIEDAKAEIEDEEYISALRKIIESKRKSVKGKSEYEIRNKLIRFALSRGFDMGNIMKVIDCEYE
ncbi:MAG: RecX family transcriptional regulator [Bacteroides sp.]|nr:RecX family transcriptional regulator [Roseburia sp.]MCM1347377.1 RecX family transcriptional regulator [Bacteroides sp.]MCM1421860.1 RecX family transcriptional regulator [Bacteroides sp.]